MAAEEYSFVEGEITLEGLIILDIHLQTRP
jgi:hypothetical protein